MARYITVPIETNPATILQRIYSYIKARIPGWTENDPNLDVWLAQAVAAEGADVADTASRVPDTIYRDLGNSLYNIPPVDAMAAIGSTTWTMRDNAGYTIDAGTQVGIRDAGGNLVPFYTVNTVVILPGSTVTAAGAITIVASQAGAAASGLAGPNVELIDILDYVLTPGGIVLTGPTTSGVDAESDAEYLNRLTGQLKLLTRTPILPQDFADLALNVTGVYRAVPLDGYNPFHNMLSLNAASVEASIADWANLANTTLTQSAAFAKDGADSLRMTAIAGADMSVMETASLVVVPGETYTAIAFFRTAVTARACKVGIQWRDVADANVGAVVYGATVNDSAANFNAQPFVTAVAPATAVKARVVVFVTAPIAAEIHYVDEISFRHGTTTDWVSGGTPETGNARMITLVGVDSNGLAISGGKKTEVDTYLESLREVNFVVNMLDPTVNLIDVTVQVKVAVGFDPATVQANVVGAINNYLSPANWGVGIAGTDSANDPQTWVNATTLYKFELAQVINGVDGVERINGPLQTSIHPNAVAEQDLALAGVVALTTPNTITVTTI